MPRAVRFRHYDDIDVLQVVDVERPVPGPGRVLVNVKAASINPVKTSIRIRSCNWSCLRRGTACTGSA